MAQARGIVLGTDGAFDAVGADGRYRITCDTVDAEGRWVVTGARHNAAARRRWRLARLDAALECAARQAGLGERYSIGFPCGNGLTRPGRIAAESVLASHGYVIAQGIRTYGIVEVCRTLCRDGVHAVVEDRLRGRAPRLGTVDHVETDGASAAWCCDLTLPFEGPVHAAHAKGYVDRETHGIGIDMVGQFDIVPVGSVLPHRGSVIQMRPGMAGLAILAAA